MCILSAYTNVMQKKQIHEIDFMRFFAACWVMIYHLGFSTWAQAPGYLYRDLAHGLTPRLTLIPLASSGWLGVELFFVISGFVITYSAQTQTGVNFMISRITRLAPAVWICASLSALVLLCVTSTPWQPVLAHWLFSVTLFPLPTGSLTFIDISYWTLGIELVFYGLVAACLARGQSKYLPYWLIAIGSWSALYLLAQLLSITPLTLWLDAIPPRLTELLLMRHGVFFAVGGLIYLSTRPSTEPKAVGAFSSILLGMLFGALCIGEINVSALEKIHMTGVAQNMLTGPLIWTCAVLLLIWSAQRVHAVDPAPSVYARLARVAGLSSYPLYLLHGVIGSSTIGWALSLGLSANTALILGLSLCVGLAVMIALWVEPVAQRELRRRLINLNIKRSNHQIEHPDRPT